MMQCSAGGTPTAHLYTDANCTSTPVYSHYWGCSCTLCSGLGVPETHEHGHETHEHDTHEFHETDEVGDSGSESLVPGTSSLFVSIVLFYVYNFRI